MGEPASPGKGSHLGENGRPESRFAQSNEEGPGQAAEVDLLDRFLVREGARLPVAPAIGMMVIVGAGLLLIGPQLAEWLAERIGLNEAFVILWRWLRIPMALFLLMLAVSVIYRFVPNTNRRFRFVAPGAVVAVIAWALALVGFSFYLSNFADYGAVYGSLGAAVALLVYLYITAATLLLGAEVNEAVYRFASETEGSGGG